MSTLNRVRPKDWACFRCRQCADCCRDLEDRLMLEPLDAYDLARCLRKQGMMFVSGMPTLICWRAACPST